MLVDAVELCHAVYVILFHSSKELQLSSESAFDELNGVGHYMITIFDRFRVVFTRPRQPFDQLFSHTILQCSMEVN